MVVMVRVDIEVFPGFLIANAEWRSQEGPLVLSTIDLPNVISAAAAVKQDP
jgi:hypothetical protein